MTGTNVLLISGGAYLDDASAYAGPAGLYYSTGGDVYVQAPINSAGTLSQLSGNGWNYNLGGAATVVSRLANANGAQTISFSGNAISYHTDATHSDSVSSGTLVDTFGSISGEFLRVQPQAWQFNASAPFSLQVCGTYGNSDTTLSTTTAYEEASGTTSGTQTSSGPWTQSTFEAPGTASLYSAYIYQSSTGTITLHFRQGGANGNQVLSVSSGSTGLKTDATHSDSVSIGNAVDSSVVSTNASGSYTLISFSMTLTHSSHDVIAGGTDSSQSSTNYYACGTGLYNNPGSNSTETNYRAACAFAATVTKMRGGFGGSGQTATYIFRNNIANGNNTISLSSSGNTVITDATHSDSVSAASYVDFACTSGSADGCSFGFVFDDGSDDTNTETGTGTLSFNGIAFSASETEQNADTGDLVFSGISFSAVGADITVTNAGDLVFTGISFADSLAVEDVVSGVLVFGGIAINTKAVDPSFYERNMFTLTAT